MEYKITEESVKDILNFAEEIPTKWGRQLQDYLRSHITKIEEVKTEEAKEPIQ